VERKIIVTLDGSHSIEIPEMNVTYHSIYGAIQESKHVFIEAGLKSLILTEAAQLNIFEMGFGTGLNALLTIIEAEKLQKEIYYETVEPFPLDSTETRSLNYCKQLDREDLQPIFEQLHSCEWKKETSITENFRFKKSKSNLLNLPVRQAGFETSETCLSGRQAFKLIYFDAFAPNAQSELWTKEIFEKMFAMLELRGVLVTYCSKGDVRRAMQAAGFTIEKLPGPKGKREILRAVR
jgi:tRNA U34 5-methylaminomethyl-2-thiouridine-forming methyltransferase MnmC